MTPEHSSNMGKRWEGTWYQRRIKLTPGVLSSVWHPLLCVIQL